MGLGGWWRAARALRAAGGGRSRAAAPGERAGMGLSGAGGGELGRRPGTAPCGAAARLSRRASPPGPTRRGLGAAAEPSVSYQQLKDLKKADVLHIDVRERWEIDRFGKIPDSINIPLGELMEALQMDPTEFKERYNQKMPSKSDPVVFSCLAGTRSKQALGFAMSLGFSRRQYLEGLFLRKVSSAYF
ncbi:thiosulfate sulfurtransferase/rhodanese-like domain-containing protein 3 isoform X2 [Sylvia atricapilla]|uniref:thiosulfate sulfurtransferase/rhodanese-like domain-containing protein 3 isoform X2 n=1 Tax=Sylvia atricapilla TaxID=48155 RepID=UPI00339444DE